MMFMSMCIMCGNIAAHSGTWAKVMVTWVVSREPRERRRMLLMLLLLVLLVLLLLLLMRRI